MTEQTYGDRFPTNQVNNLGKQELVMTDSSTSGNRVRRKILVVEGEASIRTLIHTLLARIGCESEMAENGKDALAKVDHGSFDAALLDLRCTELEPAAVVSQIYDLRPSLVGRVLVLTADVADPATIELIEEHYLLSIRRNCLRDELTGRLRALLGIPPALNHAP